MNRPTFTAVVLMFISNFASGDSKTCPPMIIGSQGPFNLEASFYREVRNEQFGLVGIDFYLENEIEMLDLISANLRREEEGKVTSIVPLVIDEGATLVSIRVSKDEIARHTLQLAYGKWVECDDGETLGVMTNRTLYELKLRVN